MNPQTELSAGTTIKLLPVEQFEDLARRCDAARLFQLLLRTANVGRAHDHLAPIVWMLARSEQILAAWSEDDSRLLPWAKLASALWLEPAVLKRFRTVDEAFPVREEYLGHLDERYMLALCESRRPSGTALRIRWLQTLKLWLLIRAVDASEAGNPLEINLRALAREVRLAVENDDETRLKVFYLMVSDSSLTTMESFESAFAALRGTVEKRLETKAKEISKLLGRVTTGDWRPATDAQVIDVPITAPAPWRPAAAPPAKPTSPDESDDDDDEADPTQTPGEQQSQRTGVALLAQAEGQFLRWDWFTCTPNEREALIDLVIKLMAPGRPPADRVGGAAMALCVACSMSARAIARVTIGGEVTVQWSLTSSMNRLARLAPRPDGGWRPAEPTANTTAGWLRDVESEWTLELSSTVTDALRSAPAGQAGSIGALWAGVSPAVKLETWVNDQLSSHPETGRLSSPSLARVAGQAGYEAVPDHALARLVISQANTVLPSPCGYASFTGATVRGAFGPGLDGIATWSKPPVFDDRNAAGSQLDSDTACFRKALAGMRTAIEAASVSGDWIRHHNLLTSYVVIALLACTGARPVRSPFESLSWFDFESGLVYVDDKAAITHCAGRLCILAESVGRLIQDCYLPHLGRLADGLQYGAPDLSTAIRTLLGREGSTRLPLLFYMGDASKVAWHEVSETGLTTFCGDAWPLPWNFPRHRLATAGRRLRLPGRPDTGLNPEIIDAILGHGEAGTETHGRFSLRVMVNDLEEARLYVEPLTRELDIRIPAAGPVVRLGRPGKSASADPAEESFGLRARQKRREMARQAAVARASEEIQRALGDRLPSALSSDEWDALGRSMLLRNGDRLPHPFASLRYETFERFVQQAWEKGGLRPRLRKRHRPKNPPAAHISPVALTARDTFAGLRAAFDAAVDPKRSPLPPMVARLASAIDLSLFGRVVDRTVLMQMAQSGHGTLIRLGGQTYVEIHTGSEWADGTPVRRFQISERAANWLKQTMRKEQNDKAIPPPFVALARLLPSHPTTVHALLRSLAGLVDQVNLLTISGLHAAILAGRIKSSALPHSDLIRAKHGRALINEAPAEDDEPEDTEESRQDRVRMGTDKSPEVAHRLVNQMLEILNEDSFTADKERAISRVLKDSPFGLGDAPHVLGRWTVSLLKRGDSGPGTKLQKATVYWYFTSLARRIAAVAYDAHLPDLDDEELTELYRTIVEVELVTRSKEPTRPPRRKAAPTPADASEGETPTEARPAKEEVSEPASAAEPDGDEPAGDHAVHVIRAITSFHEFAARRYAIEDPDWAEVGEANGRPAGRPGLITEAEYHHILRFLVGNGAHRVTRIDALESAWLQFLGYRFGVRIGEAVGLGRDDWVEYRGAIVVLVRNNSMRRLKTVHGRRAVPLVGTLLPIEQTIIDEVMRRWDERSGADAPTPLVSELTRENFKQEKTRRSARLGKLLKWVTRNPRAVYHHNRHSFANRMFALLHDEPQALGVTSAASVEEKAAARMLLLGTTVVDRRALWAVCRLLGHVSPEVSLRAYLHLETYQQSASRPAGQIYAEVEVDLDARPLDPSYLDELPVVDEPEAEAPGPAGPAVKLNYLRLRRLGRPMDRAGYVTGLPVAEAQELEETLGVVARRLERSHGNQTRMETMLELLDRVRPAALGKLVDKFQDQVDSLPLRATLDSAEVVHTIGASRQILLFEEGHFPAANAFVDCLELTEQVHILTPKNLDEPVTGLLNSGSVGAMFSAQGAVPKLQLDVATGMSKGIKVRYPDRVGIAASESGSYSGYELVVAWICCAV